MVLPGTSEDGALSTCSEGGESRAPGGPRGWAHLPGLKSGVRAPDSGISCHHHHDCCHPHHIKMSPRSSTSAATSWPDSHGSQLPLPSMPAGVPSITNDHPATALVTSIPAARVIITVTATPNPATWQPVPTSQHDRPRQPHPASILSMTFSRGIASMMARPRSAVPAFLPPSLIWPPLVRLKLLVAPQNRQTNT